MLALDTLSNRVAQAVCHPSRTPRPTWEKTPPTSLYFSQANSRCQVLVDSKEGHSKGLALVYKMKAMSFTKLGGPTRRIRLARAF